MNPLTLNAGPDAIRFETANSDYCRVQLTTQGRQFDLGGDSPSIIQTRLLEALRNPGKQPVAGRIDGHDVSWITSLDPHTTFYLSTDPNGPDHAMIYLQDAHANVIARLRLPFCDRRRTVHFNRRAHQVLRVR